jgi:carboxymethylenebutenolidase
MGEDIRLKSAAGEIGAYLATPKGTGQGRHRGHPGDLRRQPSHQGGDRPVRADGYLALAPRFFDHIKPGIELGYTPDTIAEGRGYVMTPGFTDKAVQDVDAAIQELKRRGARKVAVTGYCWGGTIAWLAATRLKPDAVSGYYGGGIHGTKNEKPTVPIQMHFGDKDMHIPMTHVNELRKLHPGVQIFDYPATTASIATSAAAGTPRRRSRRWPVRWSSSASTLASWSRLSVVLSVAKDLTERPDTEHIASVRSFLRSG